MHTQIKLERLSPGSKEGTVGKIQVAVGQVVALDDLIMEVEGKKGNTPVKATVAGTIASLEVDEGETVPLGQILATIAVQPEESTKVEAANITDRDFANVAEDIEILSTDIVVIGGGPGGYVAAIQAAKLGAKVVVIEKDQVGGTCLNRGCIPTKALVRSAQVFADIKAAEDYGIVVESPTINMAKVIERKDAIVANLVQGIEHLFHKNQIILKSGTGKIMSSTTVQIDDHTMVQAKDMIIATGSKVSKPPFLGTDLEHVMCSDEALSLKELPKKIVIIGGGIVGMEFAFIYANMGTDVTVIEYMDNILSTLDEDVLAVITSAAKEAKIKLYTSSRVEEILQGEGDNCIVRFTQNGTTKYISSDKVLACVGRSPEYKDIGIVELGIEINKTTYGIDVNDKMQTNIPNIYAIGDVTNIMQLAHVASSQGIVAAKNILGQEATMHYQAVPSAIFTSPEIATVGFTEKELEKAGKKFIVGKFPFSASGKAMTYGQTRGFVKILTEETTGNVLGCGIIGPHASDLIAEVTLAIKNGLTATDIISTIHAHPTTSEAIHEAALSVQGGAIHFAD